MLKAVLIGIIIVYACSMLVQTGIIQAPDFGAIGGQLLSVGFEGLRSAVFGKAEPTSNPEPPVSPPAPTKPVTSTVPQVPLEEITIYPAIPMMGSPIQIEVIADTEPSILLRLLGTKIYYRLNSQQVKSDTYLSDPTPIFHPGFYQIDFNSGEVLTRKTLKIEGIKVVVSPTEIETDDESKILFKVYSSYPNSVLSLFATTSTWASRVKLNPVKTNSNGFAEISMALDFLRVGTWSIDCEYSGGMKASMLDGQALFIVK